MKKLKCPIKPRKNYLFVERLAALTTTQNGLYLPDQAVEKPQYGRVLAVGEGIEAIAESDIVVFGKYAGADIDVLRKEPIVMLEDDEVVGVVVDSKLVEELTA